MFRISLFLLSASILTLGFGHTVWAQETTEPEENEETAPLSDGASADEQAPVSLETEEAPPAARSTPPCAEPEENGPSSSLPSPGAKTRLSPESAALLRQRQRAWNLASPELEWYRQKRNAGLSAFILGIVLEAGGGAMLGVGASRDNLALIVPGAVTGALGLALFVCGIGVWASNQIRMERVANGLPVSHRPRFRGLSWSIDPRGGVPSGLGAAFSF